MTFAAYLANIQAKTGLGADDFRKAAAGKGFVDGKGLADGVKAGEIVAWLKSDYGLGHGHAMAIVKLLKAGGKGPGK